ncbi:MAG: hypothetical protein U1E46_13665 [Hyphomicrobiales bacterium]
MDDVAIARAVHLLALVHWIGGVFFVTAVVLPVVRSMAPRSDGLALFMRIERRFSRQVKYSVSLAAVSGLYMAQKLEVWNRFTNVWWMAGMAVLWVVFALILFVAEPLFLDRWFEHRATAAPEATLLLVERGHRVLLIVSLALIAGTVLGVHGGPF